MNRTVRTLLLIAHLAANEDGALELFNIPLDLYEENYLTAHQPARLKEPHERLIAWRKDVGALIPTPNPDFEPNAKSNARATKKTLSLSRHC